MMSENEARINLSHEIDVPLPFAQRVGAAVVNLLGAGISLDSILRLLDNISDDSFKGVATAAGELVVGSVVITMADQWKKRVWVSEHTINTSENNAPTQ